MTRWDPVGNGFLAVWLDNASRKLKLLSEVSSGTFGATNGRTLLPTKNADPDAVQRRTPTRHKFEDDEIVYDGRPISPARLANMIGGTNRNACGRMMDKMDPRIKNGDLCTAAASRRRDRKFFKELEDELEQTSINSHETCARRHAQRPAALHPPLVARRVAGYRFGEERYGRAWRGASVFSAAPAFGPWNGDSTSAGTQVGRVLRNAHNLG